eukprot:1806566-Karenia_brevis.AAC.1
MSKQLCRISLQLTEGESDDLVRNAGRLGIACGLEAWRILVRRWDPLTAGRARNLLKSIMTAGRCTMDQMQEALERWEEL